MKILFIGIFLEGNSCQLLQTLYDKKLNKNIEQIHTNYILIYLMQQVNKKIYFFPQTQHSAFQSFTQNHMNMDIKPKNNPVFQQLSPKKQRIYNNDHIIEAKQSDIQKLVRLSKYARELFQKIHGISQSNKNQLPIQERILDRYHNQPEENNSHVHQDLLTKDEIEPNQQGLCNASSEDQGEQQYNVRNKKKSSKQNRNKNNKNNEDQSYTLEDCLQFCLEEYHRKQRQVQSLLTVTDILEDIYTTLSEQYRSTCQKAAQLEQKLQYHQSETHNLQQIIHELQQELRSAQLENEKLTTQNQYQKYNKKIEIQQILNDIGEDQKKEYEKLCNVIKMLQKDIEWKDKKILEIQQDKIKEINQIKTKYQLDIKQKENRVTLAEKQIVSLLAEQEKYKKLINQIGLKTTGYQQTAYQIPDILPLTLHSAKNISNPKSVNRLQQVIQRNNLKIPLKRLQNRPKYSQKQFKIITNIPTAEQDKNRRSSNRFEQINKMKLKKMRSMNQEQILNQDQQILEIDRELEQHELGRNSKCQGDEQHQKKQLVQVKDKEQHLQQIKINENEQNQELYQAEKEKQLYKVSSLSKLSEVSSCTSNNWKFKTTLFSNINDESFFKTNLKDIHNEARVVTDFKSARKSDHSEFEGFVFSDQINKNMGSQKKLKGKDSEKISIGLMTQLLIQQQQLGLDSPINIKKNNSNKKQQSPIQQIIIKKSNFIPEDRYGFKRNKTEKQENSDELMVNLRTSSSTQEIQALKSNYQLNKNPQKNSRLQNFFVNLKEKQVHKPEISSSRLLNSSVPNLNLSSSTSLTTPQNNSSSLHNFITKLVARRTHKKRPIQSIEQKQKNLKSSRISNSFSQVITSLKDSFIGNSQIVEKKGKRNSLQKYETQKYSYLNESKFCFTERLTQADCVLEKDEKKIIKNKINEDLNRNQQLPQYKNVLQKANFKKNKMNCSMIVIPNYKVEEVKKNKQKIKTKDKSFMDNMYDLIVKKRVRRA